MKPTKRRTKVKQSRCPSCLAPIRMRVHVPYCYAREVGGPWWYPATEFNTSLWPYWDGDNTDGIYVDGCEGQDSYIAKVSRVVLAKTHRKKMKQVRRAVL